MPFAAKRPCPVCRKPVRSRDECHPRPKDDFRFKRSIPSLPDGSAVYDAEWRRVSRIIRQQRPVCEYCQQRPSVEVDHVLRPQQRPDLRLEPSNLKAACKQCHYRKTHNKDSWCYTDQERR